MLRATELAQLLLRPAVQSGAWAIDATVGNGHDTKFLADLVGPSGRVFGFDVQAAALAVAAARLDGRPQVTLQLCGHEHLAAALPAEAAGQVAAVMFNLGYLPGADKQTTTRPATTLAGLAQALDLVAVRGMITLVLYPGHPGGADEAAAVRTYIARLPSNFAVAHWCRLTPAHPAPALLAIERRS
jgi:SAM-dependent methyltransferase